MKGERDNDFLSDKLIAILILYKYNTETSKNLEMHFSLVWTAISD